MTNYIALAIPLFFVLIVGELAWARARGVRVYRLGDALTDLSCGVTSQMAAIFFAALQLAAYGYLYEHHRVLSYPTWFAWLFAFVAVDFAYYWWHRLSHEVNVLWAAHVVHHQSEDYNLAVALRQAVLTSWTSLFFYLPLAVLGVPTVVFATTLAFSTLYQFWIHTRLIGKVRGPVEYLLNMPEHHRVHHAVNPQYLDKNYGATLIVWDRWFGTFQAEHEPPRYGITKPLSSYNPLWAQVHYWVELIAMARATPRLADKWRVFLRGPAWQPPGVVRKEVERVPGVVYDVPITRSRAAYLVAQYALLIVFATALIFYAEQAPLAIVVAGALAVVLGVLAMGGLIERKRWAAPLEVTRVAATLAIVVAWLV
jgi:alkylglycerol monooxygenase